MQQTAFARWSFALFLLSACGGSPPQAAVAKSETPAEVAPTAAQESEAPADEASTALATESPPAATGFPDTCAKGFDACVPDPAFVKRLCNDVHQDTALYMFRSGTPWQRVYLRGKVEAINASGGATVQGFLEFDEEVLVLRQRKVSAEGIQVGDSSASYDALRWNGSCVSLDGGEVTHTVPPKAKYSRVEWRYVGDNMRTALRRDEKLAESVRARQKECKGATMGAVSKKCEILDNKLVDEIVKYVRNTADLPEPEEKF